MGMYDWVRWKCPACGEENDDQTKEGPCRLGVYGPKNCDTEVARFFTDYGSFTCDCGAEYKFRKVGKAPRGVCLRAYRIDEASFDESVSDLDRDPEFSADDM